MRLLTKGDGCRSHPKWLSTARGFGVVRKVYVANRTAAALGGHFRFGHRAFNVMPGGAWI